MGWYEILASFVSVVYLAFLAPAAKHLGTLS